MGSDAGAQPTDIAVIGGGAAGLAAAIFAAEALPARTRYRIIVLEGATRLGAKILDSGGGRCNVTNACVTAGDFHGSQPVIRNILAAFDARAAVGWFRSLGVELKEEAGGKLFPTTNRAKTVLDALVHRCRAVGVEICTQCRVTRIMWDSEAGDGLFTVQHAGGVLRTRRLVMATGGRSLPRSGSDGQGWELVSRLGHSITRIEPALVPLRLDPAMFHAELSGVTQDVELTMIVDGKVMDRRVGSLLWTHFGISGPVVLDMSRFWTLAVAEGREVELQCHFLPGQDFQAVEQWLLSAARTRPTTPVSRVLAQRLPDRVAEAICRTCGITSQLSLAHLPAAQRRMLVHRLTAFPLPVIAHRGWNYAEVTAGGVPLSEIDYRTMASRKVPGLFLVGEMLDCDGRIGGFNFQWAWSTGYVGGRGAAASLVKEDADGGRQ